MKFSLMMCILYFNFCYLFRAFKYFSFFTLSMSRIKITFYNNFDICLFYNFEKFRSL